jgi:D-alanine-D-alanine ligase
MGKLRVGVIFGGRSAEHEISLLSARNVVEALDPEKYDVILIGIDKSGRWFLTDKKNLASLTVETGKPLPAFSSTGTPLSVRPGAAFSSTNGDEQSLNLPPLDVVFPVLHGQLGEDGAIQGLFRILDIPFVGPSVLGSAIGMDKDVAKRLLRDAGIGVARFVTVPHSRHRTITFQSLSEELGLPLFVKPANLGSSVGVSKVTSAAELDRALDEAFRYDTKVLVEEFVKGREIEVSVLGNEEPIASVAGEIIPSHEFYSYEAKYLDAEGARLVIPAKLDPERIKEAERLALRTFECLCCEGMARVDMFLTENGSLLINEINTIPGFTAISMYPKLWEASGIPYAKLIDRLIQLAIDRHERDSVLSVAATGC